MSDDAMDFLDLMGREGPCFHCGIDYTPLWRSGPPEKPVLCNACGSRWKAKGTLEDYVPKHGTKVTQSSQSSKMASKQTISFAPASELKEPQFRSNAVGQEHSSYFLGDDTNAGNVSGISLMESPIQTQNLKEANKAPLWDPNSVWRRKRSTLEQHVLSPAEMLHQQLYYAHQGSEFAKETDDNEDNAKDVLIFERINRYIPENEIGLGCMLLKPPSPAKDSKLDFQPEPKFAPSPIKESKPESSVGFQSLVSSPNEMKPEPAQVFQFRATATTKTLKPQALPAKAGGSSLVNVPMGDSSQEGTIALKFKNSLDVTERMSRRNSSTHHMITRSRASSCEFIIHPSTTPSVSSTNRRRRGRPRIHQPQGEITRKEAKYDTTASTKSSSRNPKLIPEENTVEALANDVENKLSFKNPSLMED